MDRLKAISIICEHKISNYDSNLRNEIILNWWSIDNSNNEFNTLPKSLQDEITNFDEPIHSITDSRYDPLLVIALKAELKGIKNEYLSEIIFDILQEEITVEGRPEELFRCPCCCYKTIIKRGNYYVCPVCYWEDDGNDEPSIYSSPNHMTLIEGKENFEKYGVCSISMISKVKSDMKRRYYTG